MIILNMSFSFLCECCSNITMDTVVNLIVMLFLIGSCLVEVMNSTGEVEYGFTDDYQLEYSEVNQTDLIEKVYFCLYTKKNINKFQLLYINDTEALKSSNYDPNVITRVLVHGFKSNIYQAAVNHIKKNFLKRDEETNIIAVDWSLITIFETYHRSFKLAKPTGILLGQLLNFLIEQGTPLKNIHIIGHSLGAHVAGFASSSIKAGKVPRITGLDPAAPRFKIQTLDDRLDASDADFVDCIHTSAGVFGILQPICTADFYPNGGTCPQPGCSAFDKLDLCLFAGTCSHERSHIYFAESLLEGHTFYAKTCDSLYFNNIECQNQGALMGFPANSSFQGVFFVETNSEFPYAKGT